VKKTLCSSEKKGKGEKKKLDSERGSNKGAMT